MKRASFSEEKIIDVLKEAEPGAMTADLAGQHGVCEVTFYNWKAKYGGLEVSEARRLRELEIENAKLKRAGRHEHSPSPVPKNNRVCQVSSLSISAWGWRCP